MTDQWWSAAKQDPAAIPFRNKFDAARDPLTARNAIGAVDAKYVSDAIAAAGGGGGGAPTGAQYITAAADATLTAERVLTNTATVTWDFTTAGQAKANTVGGGGNVSNSGTPSVGQYAKWVTATTIQGVAPATVLSDIGAQPAGSYQPLDGDLTSLAAASGTNTIYYRSAADTWSPVVVSTGLAFSGGNLTATSAGGNVSNVGTPVSGQIAQWTGATTIQGIDASALGSQTINCGRLSWVSTTALSFLPYNGDRIKIAGVIYPIPSGGIASLTNGGLSASTLYYVYAFNSSGTITGEFSTTTHAVSSTAGNVGTEIKSGDNSRTLIGMIRTNASSQFQDDAANRFVLSWFNRRNIGTVGATTNGTTTTSTTFVELGSTFRANFLKWGDEAVPIAISGLAFNNTANAVNTSNIGVNGTTPGLVPNVSDQSPTASGYSSLSGSTIATTLAEGFNFITPLALVSTSTGGFHLSVSAIIRG